MTVISVQFKDRNKVFRGKTYDYRLSRTETIPEKGSIIRMLDNDYNFIAYGTRVKVVNVWQTRRQDNSLKEIKYVTATLDD